ncbi:MAG: DHA2 family efflux MFS transporter permease subunit [Chromatiales bacterium]|jgi:MFS transporter, DHA2 family, multidrug resistance protein|nr:DHA2 family efflux MFS transporter permease subunit [Chromatiales bacterium]
MTTDAPPPNPAIPPQFANSPNYKWLATATVILGMLSSVLSSTMVNVAIPDIMGTYGIGQDQAHWMSTATLAAMPVMMLMNGWFVNNFGARKTYVGACVIFCIASLIGQFMPYYYGLVVVRVIQGACAGLLQPLTMTVMFPLFPADQRGKAMGIYGMGFILGPALGPTVGGIIVDSWHWRDIFGASIPLMLVAVFMGLRYLPPRLSTAQPVRLNWLSLSLIAVAMATFLTAISNGSRLGWGSTQTFGMFFTAACCLCGFLWVEFTTNAPLLQMRLFSSRAFSISVLVGFMFGAGMFGSLYVLPVFTQTVMGYSASKAGLLLMFTGLMMIPTFPIGGRLAQQPRPGLPISLGMLMFGGSSLALATADTNSAFWFVALWATFGRVGLSFAMPSLQTGALRELSPELLPYGAGTMNFLRMTGAAIGTNVLAIILDNRLIYHADYLASTQLDTNTQSKELLDQIGTMLIDHGITAAERGPMAMHYLSQIVVAQANSLAFKDGFIVLAGGFLMAAVSALALAGKPRSVPVVAPPPTSGTTRQPVREAERLPGSDQLR